MYVPFFLVFGTLVGRRYQSHLGKRCLLDSNKEDPIACVYPKRRAFEVAILLFKSMRKKLILSCSKEGEESYQRTTQYRKVQRQGAEPVTFFPVMFSSDTVELTKSR